jgi:hypothetical protein
MNIFFVNILTNLRRWYLEPKNFEKIIFANKNWPNDVKVGCKAPSNLVELIDSKIDLEDKLKWIKAHLSETN